MENPIVHRLKEVLREKSEKNPRFGIRALARQLKMPAPTLSRILSGKRGLSLVMARRIVRGITEDFAEQRRLLKAHALEPKQVPAKPTLYRYLTLKELERLSHWGHSAILEVLRRESGIRSLATIAASSGLTEVETEKCLKDLEGLKLVDRSLKRGWYTKGQNLSSIRWEGEIAWKCIHQGYGERALHYMKRYNALEATIQGITFLVPDDRIQAARQRIQEFAEELSDELSQGDNGTLYRLNVQLFPLGSRPRPLTTE